MKPAETLVVRVTIFEQPLFRAKSGDKRLRKDNDLRRHGVYKPKPYKLEFKK